MRFQFSDLKALKCRFFLSIFRISRHLYSLLFPFHSICLQVSYDQYALYFLTFIARSTTRADSLVAGFPDPLAFGSGSGNLANSLVEQNDHSSLPLLHRPCVFLCFSSLSFFVCCRKQWISCVMAKEAAALLFSQALLSELPVCIFLSVSAQFAESGPNLFEEGRTKSVSEIITSSGIFSLSNFQSLVHISPPCLNHVCLPFFTTVFLNVDCFTSLFQRTTS